MSPCLTGNRGETEDYYVILSTTGGAFTTNIESETILDASTSEILYKVSPNPSDGIFKIENFNSIAASYYEVVNINGAVIEKREIKSNEEIFIDISSHSAGMYFLMITDEQKNKQVMKLVRR